MMSFTGGDITWSGTSTDCSSTTTIAYMLAPQCEYDRRHTIERLHAKGSNGIVRREHGKCVYCGKPYTRTIRWDTKDARSWWEPLEDDR